MDTKTILRSIARCTSREDLKTICTAASERGDLLWKRERDADSLNAYREVARWPVGTTLYVHGEVMEIPFGYGRVRGPLANFRSGACLIVHRLMPRAHAVLFTVPDRPEWERWLYRADGSTLRSLQLSTDPPSAVPDMTKSPPSGSRTECQTDLGDTGGDTRTASQNPQAQPRSTLSETSTPPPRAAEPPGGGDPHRAAAPDG